MSERAELKTKDGVKIVGDYYPAGSSASPAALLLHMMPSDRKSWTRFAEKLQRNGFQILAIDLRGHGESTETETGERLDYKNFSDEDHQSSIEDVRAAHEWLKEKGANILHLAGASIGANLALRYLAENSEAISAILLSPGINYHGITALPFAKSLTPDKKVFVVGAKDDQNVSGNDKMCEEIFGAVDMARKKIKILETGGHGTDILDAHQDFEDEIISFLKEE